MEAPYSDEPTGDGIDRRGFLKCMAWAGTGLLYTAAGGLLQSTCIAAGGSRAGSSELSFVQISDSHIGFNKPANPDVTATLREAVARINALPTPPEFLIHTGDLTHLSRPEEFDAVREILSEARVAAVHTVPGEHDLLDAGKQQFRQRFGGGAAGDGWYSFDQMGVHFIGLNNVARIGEGGLGSLGEDQLRWLERDLAGRGSSTPVVVFAHVPLWEVYPQWGWGTEDGARALALLRRFGSVTVLNGHIHQTLQKVEGAVTFHTARSTAFPQPEPGKAAGPGPVQVDAGRLRSVLGITRVSYREGKHPLALVDTPLADG